MDIGTGSAALLGASIGVSGGVFVALIGAWNDRRLARDTQLRQWRIEQLRPTLDAMNRVVRAFADADYRFKTAVGSRFDNSDWELLGQSIDELSVLHDWGHSLVFDRPRAQMISRSFDDVAVAYAACLNELQLKMDEEFENLRAGRPCKGIFPSEGIGDLTEAIVAVNQETERYIFGRVGGPTRSERVASAAKNRAVLESLERFAETTKRISRAMPSGLENRRPTE